MHCATVVSTAVRVSREAFLTFYERATGYPQNTAGGVPTRPPWAKAPPSPPAVGGAHKASRGLADVSIVLVYP